MPMPAPIDDATGCCTTSEAMDCCEPVGVSGGLPIGVDPFAPLAPPVYLCDGLGTVPSDPDPVRPETWD